MGDELADVVVRAVGDLTERAFDFLDRLVSAHATVGREALAQEIVAEELGRLGFEVAEMPVPDSIVEDPLAGVPPASYAGRPNVLACTGPGELSVLINGHVDVVPADPVGWSNPPWRATRRDGWLYGRGAGDMAGGFAMATLALESLRVAAPEALETPIGFLSVIEEECTGNGTLAALRSGILADAVLLPEPTDLRILLGGVGIVWVDVTLAGAGGHAESADGSPRVLDAALGLVAALEDLGRRAARADEDPVYDGVEEPYRVNVGTVRAGDWRSSVASACTLGVRFAHPRAWSAADAIGRIEEVVASTCDGAGLSYTILPSGYRAQGYHLDPESWLVDAVRSAHAQAHGEPCGTFVLGTTTDARYYVNVAEVPALCYGPAARRIHGIDEAVELDSIVRGAQTLALLLARGGPAGGGAAAAELQGGLYG